MHIWSCCNTHASSLIRSFSNQTLRLITHNQAGAVFSSNRGINISLMTPHHRDSISRIAVYTSGIYRCRGKHEMKAVSAKWCRLWLVFATAQSTVTGTHWLRHWAGLWTTGAWQWWPCMPGAADASSRCTCVAAARINASALHANATALLVDSLKWTADVNRTTTGAELTSFKRCLTAWPVQQYITWAFLDKVWL